MQQGPHRCAVVQRVLQILLLARRAQVKGEALIDLVLQVRRVGLGERLHEFADSFQVILSEVIRCQFHRVVRGEHLDLLLREP